MPDDAGTMLASVAEYLAATGITTSDATRDAALSQIIAAVEAAIKRLCKPYQFEAVTQTDVMLDAPWQSPWLILPLVPVRSVTSIYYNPTAFGIAANFTSDHLLVAPGSGVTNPDYALEVDMQPEGWSRSGRVRRLNRSVWGVSYERPLGRLGWNPVPEAKSIKVSYSAGHTTPPADVVQAVFLATSLVYARRKTGAPVASESWNGYSTSAAGPFTAVAAVQSPDVLALLAPYLSPVRVGGS